MKTLVINLPDPTATKLEEVAGRLSVSPEELLILSLEEKLVQLDAQFERVSEFVLNKNAELYDRLS